MYHCSMCGELYGTHQRPSETVIWDRAVTNVGKGWLRPNMERAAKRHVTVANVAFSTSNIALL